MMVLQFTSAMSIAHHSFAHNIECKCTITKLVFHICDYHICLEFWTLYRKNDLPYFMISMEGLPKHPSRAKNMVVVLQTRWSAIGKQQLRHKHLSNMWLLREEKNVLTGKKIPFVPKVLTSYYKML